MRVIIRMCYLQNKLKYDLNICIYLAIGYKSKKMICIYQHLIQVKKKKNLYSQSHTYSIDYLIL